MNSDKDFAAVKEKIKSLPDSHQIAEDFTEILGLLSSVELDAADTIFRELFQTIYDKFTSAFFENLNLFETSEDDFVKAIIKSNYEDFLQVTKATQDVLDLVYRKSPVEISHIESIVVYVPRIVQMYSIHLKNCSELHTNTFIDEITQTNGAVKSLYGIYLHLLEFSITITCENETLSVVLVALCQMPNDFFMIDPNSLLSCWKCFNVLTCRYKAYIGHFDFSLVVKLINEHVCDILQNINMTILEKRLKIINFLIKILFINIQKNFYDELNRFVEDLLIFYIKIYKFINSEGLDEFFKQIDGYLGNLIAEKPQDFKYAFENLKIFDMDCPIGTLRFLNRILQLINDIAFDWPISALINIVFDVLPLCQNEFLFHPKQNGWVYQNLIVNISAAILINNVHVEGTMLLINYLFELEVFGAMLALEVYLLVLRNIPQDDCMRLVINLFKAIGRLEGVYFTHKPEMIYLKCLVQRIFKFLPDESKLDVMKKFNPVKHIQVWRFLGFACIQNQEIFKPIINNTVKYVKHLENYKRQATPLANQPAIDQIPLNIGEGIGLLATITDRNIIKNQITTITSFMDTFLSLNFPNNIVNNNLFQYFIMKTRFFDPKIISIFQILCQNPAYCTSIFRIISTIAYSNRQDELTEVALIFPYVFENSPTLLKQLYFEMLRDLKDHKKSSFDVLLERLDVKLVGQMSKYFQRFDHMNSESSLSSIEIDIERFHHKCLKWNHDVPMQRKLQQPQQLKFNEINGDKGIKRKLKQSQLSLGKKSKTDDTRKTAEEKRTLINDVENDISAVSDVIQNLKSEAKCLMKALKADKLTVKDGNNLKNVIAQLSSVLYR